MGTLISLVPDTSLQFWDIALNLEQTGLRSRSFWEARAGNAAADGKVPVELRPLDPDRETGVMIDPVSLSSAPEDETYSVSRAQALEPFLDQWVPLPYFAIAMRDRDGAFTYQNGPSNWVRGRLTMLAEPSPGKTHHLTLVFDTTLRNRGTGPYAGLATEDSMRQADFGFVADFRSMGWFLNETWIGDWLDELFREFLRQKRGRPLTADDFPHGCEHYARYITYLDLLWRSDVLPQIRLIDTVSADLPYHPVAVDLVLDVGNSRTCGLLIEEHRGQGQSLSDSYPLTLRDLSQPIHLYDKPFDSRVEFARAQFGNDRISRRSGIANAFSWPSPVRVGPEASRLSAARSGNEGATGLSSPKRYLWDDRPMAQSWRFNERGNAQRGIVVTDPPVSGAILAQVSEDGRLLESNNGLQPALHARFSRSSLFTFMLTEILMQAISQINAPANRAARRDADKPRELRRLVLTLPPGMPIFEQRILRTRAGDALKLAWHLLGWTDVKRRTAMPRIVDNLDEATATQIVWLHNEITSVFAGNGAAMFATLGRVRPEIAASPARSLRIASIDIGGGTTDLMVATYTIPEGERFEPRQDFRESFKIAGDDVVHQVITGIVLPCFEASLRSAGIAVPRDLLVRMLAQDLMGQSEQQRQARRVFVSQILEPVALAILEAAEKSVETDAGAFLHGTIRDLLAANPGGLTESAAYLDVAAARAGANSFQVADVVITADTKRVDAAVRTALGRVISDLCEVVWHYDCDVLLLSGRPTKLRAVIDMVLAKLPLPPHRVIGMHHYRVGPHYPFRDGANRIDDPKTTVAVGAMLCVQAEGRLQNFSLPASRFHMRSTARIIGRMDNDGQIRDANVLLADVALDDAGDVGFSLKFFNNLQIGFRQLPIERWTSTPLYQLEFNDPDAARGLALPLTVRVRRRGTDPDSANFEADRERFDIEEISDANGSNRPPRSLRLRLQTMEDEAGYWRDTGRLLVV
ncbi:MAG: virulence factor SrfB [Acidiphilium sp.]|nr:virulence factor SrfB [Acidiphilium sp.]MDD4936398.1 virulence factor SrfB [Acidiphilium sp.]